MPPLTVVEDLDVLEERGAGLVLGPKGLAGQELALQGGEEAFGHRIVIARGDVRTTSKAMKMRLCRVAY
jgi:hypothetical protein